MNNLYAAYCILTIDHSKKENLIVSANNETIELPIFKIDHPRLLYNELRYNLQQILFKETFDPEIIKKITLSHIDVQNELLLKYIENDHSDKFDTNNDIFILCSFIMAEPNLLNKFEWKKFNFAKSLTGMDVTTSIIDFVIEKSIL